jgi:3-hydroxyisobutyrate dehydrogenase-like beta-hydroxyacid dehydrogenase
VTVRVAVLGLGEAGSLLAVELAALGDEVHGFDPGDTPTPNGVARFRRPGETVTGSELVLALTPGREAAQALAHAIDAVGEGVVYADLSTGSPALKQQLAEMAAARGISFADVALMAAIPGRGLSVPALASGTGARRFADIMNARGGNVEVVGERAGEAATRKLLRSVVMKGLAALLAESMAAGSALDEEDWLWQHLVNQLTSIDISLMERLLFDTALHAQRRLDEMEAARDMLRDLGVPAEMTEATIARLRRLAEGATPPMPTAR